MNEVLKQARDALEDLLGPQDDPRSGWHSGLASSPELYQCEFCRVEHLDCALLPHAEDCPITGARNALAAIDAQMGQAGPQPIDTAPKDGTRFLAWYPKHLLDEDDCPTGDPIGGAWGISSNNGGMWDEPDFLGAVGAWFFDNWCFAEEPTRWMSLPPDVDAALPNPPKD